MKPRGRATIEKCIGLATNNVSTLCSKSLDEFE